MPRSNTLAGGAAALVSTAVACRSFSSAAGLAGRIRNNILGGGAGSPARYGVYEDGEGTTRECRPEVLENNDFVEVDVAYRAWTGGAEVERATVADVDAEAWARANFSAPALLGPTAHLMPGSPCIDRGTATEAPARDIDGEPRPRGGGFDVGADEAG